MNPSSRTPEGEPNRCPLCGKTTRLEPSVPPGDAACPHCGRLLWFDAMAGLEPHHLASVPPGGPPPPAPAHLTPGASVRINEGPFENFTGVVERVVEDKGLVRVVLTIFNRATPVEFEYRQVD